MKSIILIGILFLSIVCAKAQETQTNESSKGVTFEELLKVKGNRVEVADNSQFSIGDDGCGNPATESQTYDYRKGKVIKITSSNDLIVKVTHSNADDDEREKDNDESKLITPIVFRVFLVGIEKGFNKEDLNKFLTEKILNQEVQVIGNTKNSWKTEKDNSRELYAVVWLLGEDEDIDDISEYLLENGIAKYKPFESANLVSMVMPCRLQKAEKKAKEAKLGIWAK